MSKADFYHSRADACDRLAIATSREIAALWRNISDQ